jgi:hypothetical protein
MEDNLSQGESSNSDSTERRQNDDAVFVGWQKTPSGKVFALYNVIAESHPLHGSTVTEPTLREHNLPIPQTPPPESGDEGFTGSASSGETGNFR